MEIKGEKIFLSKTEQSLTGYPSPIERSDIAEIGDQLQGDIQDLVDLRADDGLDMTTRAMLVVQGAKLDSRSIFLNNVHKNLAREQGLTIEQELQEIIERGQQHGD